MEQLAKRSSTRTLPRSPGWELFRLNAFRVLRLPSSVSAQQAALETERLLVAMAHDPQAAAEHEELPWLDAADELEVQGAAQKLEEPLRRLVDQVLWFDFEQNTDATLLRSALRGLEQTRVQGALRVLDATPPTLAGAALTAEESTEISAALDASNFRLLMAMAALHGRIESSVTSAPDAVRLTVKGENGLLRVDDPHLQLAPPPADVDAGQMLESALKAWGVLLQSPALGQHLRRQIARLEDDLIGSDDVDTVVAAVWAALADAVAGELKYFLVAGNLERATDIGSAIAKSGIPTHAWVPSLKSLRLVFQVELEELSSLIGEDADLESVDVYLARVSKLSARFAPVDAAGAMGLEQALDQAVLLAFRAIQNIEGPLSMEEYLERAALFSDALETCASVAKSESLKQRILALTTSLEQRKKGVCHYCERRQAGRTSWVRLNGRSPSYLEWAFWIPVMVLALVVRTLYMPARKSARALVPRCEPCAGLFIWVRNRSYVVAATLLGAGLLLQLAPLYVVGAALISIWPARRLLGAWITPEAERKYWEVSNAAGYRWLTENGFGSLNITGSYGKNTLEDS